MHTFMIGCYRTVHPDGVPIAEERFRVPCRSQRYLHYFVTMGMSAHTGDRTQQQRHTNSSLRSARYDATEKPITSSCRDEATICQVCPHRGTGICAGSMSVGTQIIKSGSPCIIVN